MGYAKWRKKKEQTLKQLKEMGIDETDAKLIEDDTYVEVEEIGKLNLDSLVEAKVNCAFTINGRLYIEEFKGWVDGYGTFLCAEEELEAHM